METICINNGYFATKVKTDHTEFQFESKISKADSQYDSDIAINGNKYRVGAGKNDLELDKTLSFTQEACINYAIQKATMDKEVRVMSALPINAYSNVEARNNYKQWLNSHDRIAECEVYPEGAAAMLSDFDWYKNKLVCLLDVGGLTINSMIFDDRKLVPDTAFSCQLGSIILDNRLRVAFQKNELANIPEYQIKYLQNSPISKAVYEDYIKELKQELRRMNYPTNIQYRLTGGGAIKYSNLFKKHLSDCFISDSAVWENVRGLWIMSKVVWKS